MGIIIPKCRPIVHIRQDRVHKLPLVSTSLFLIYLGMESGRDLFCSLLGDGNEDILGKRVSHVVSVRLSVSVWGTGRACESFEIRHCCAM